MLYFSLLIQPINGGQASHLKGSFLDYRFRYRTGDQSLVRQINLSVIMRQLRAHAPISRAALAEMTGLNKTTVSSLVNELIERQFVREVGLEESGPGRGAGRLGILLTLDPQAGYIVSAEIGVDFITVICTNFAPEIIWHHTENIEPDTSQHTIIDRVLALLQIAADAGRESCSTFLGIAVGVPGLVDQSSGSLLFAPNLKWQNVPLRDIIQKSFEAPVVVDNEASIAALGEYYFGAAQHYQEVLYISAGVGLGGGIVHEGQLFSGVTGFGSEFGHMTMDPDGELCNCGNHGCWETLVSQAALFRIIESGVKSGQPSQFSNKFDDCPTILTVPMIVEAAKDGDKLAIQGLNNIGQKLGIGIASLVNALNPDLVVFGGILSLASEFLLPVVENVLQRRALPWNRNATKIVTAHHGLNACVMGGVAKVYQTILAEPDILERQMV